MDGTRVVTFKDLLRAEWSVWRVITRSGSRYHVALRSEGAKSFAILRGTSKADGSVLEVHDGQARLEDGRSVHEVLPPKWVGQGMVFGSASTSPVTSVEPELDQEIITQVTGVKMVVASKAPRSTEPPRSSAPPPRPSYPLNFIEDVEVAGALLRRVYQRHGLTADLAKVPAHLERMKLALTECALLVQAMGKKVAGEGA